MAKKRDLLPFEFPATETPVVWVRTFSLAFRRFLDLLRQKFNDLEDQIEAGGGGGGGAGGTGAPNDRSYVTVGGEGAALPASRRLAVQDDLTLADGGPGGVLRLGRTASRGALFIPELEADPSSPDPQTAWVRHTRSAGLSGGSPTGLLLALAVHQADPVELYELSYRTTEDTTRRVALA